MIDDLLGRSGSMGRSLLLALPNLAVGLVVVLVFWLVSRLVGRLVRSVVERAGRPVGVQVVLGRLTGWAVLALGLLVALAVVFPTVTAASLFGALGIGSVAIGFAFKDILQNLLAGILILLTRPFRIGDQIVSGAHEGGVEDIAVRSTSLRTYDDRRVVIPNSELYTNRVTVNTAYARRRLAVDVGIGYANQVLTAVKPALVAAGIDLPLPTQQVLLHDQTEPVDGDRTRQREGWPADPDQKAPVE